MADLKANMDKTTQEKRDRDNQVTMLQGKIKELEELVEMTKRQQSSKPTA